MLGNVERFLEVVFKLGIKFKNRLLRVKSSHAVPPVTSHYISFKYYSPILKVLFYKKNSDTSLQTVRNDLIVPNNYLGWSSYDWKRC